MPTSDNFICSFDEQLESGMYPFEFDFENPPPNNAPGKQDGYMELDAGDGGSTIFGGSPYAFDKAPRPSESIFTEDALNPHPTSHRGSSSSSSSLRSAGSNSPRPSIDASMGASPRGWPEDVGGNGDMDVDNVDLSQFLTLPGDTDSPSPPAANEQSPTLEAHGNPVSVGRAAKRRKAQPTARTGQPSRRQTSKARVGSSSRPSPIATQVFGGEPSPNAAYSSQLPSPVSDLALGNVFGSLGMPANWMALRNGLTGASPFPISRSDSAYMSPVSQELSTGNTTPPPLPTALPRLVIHPMPQKSRVETQIPLKITLHNTPKGIKKVHLPTHTISKPKLLQKPPMGPSPDTLELTTMLVCTSAMLDDTYRRRAFGRASGRPVVDELNSPMDGAEDEENKSQNGGEVRICTGCITRERKRAGRKKHKKPEEEELWDRYERERAIVFNTLEVKEWQTVTLGMVDPTGAGFINGALPEGTVQVDAPMRIACYCRHHGEKMGFQVIITLKDYLGSIVAQGISSSIMITDDHKTPAHAGPTTAPGPVPVPVPASQLQHSPGPHSQPLVPNGQSMASQTGITQSVASDLQAPGQNAAPLAISVSPHANNPQPISTSATPRSLSRQTSPASPLGGGGRKRKASIVPASLTMTKIEADQSFSSMGSNIHNDSTVISTASAPFLANPTHRPQNRDASNQGQQQMLGHIPQSFGPGTATSNNGRNDQFIFSGMNGRPMMLDRTVPQLFSAPPSAHPSRPPSPNQQLRPEVQSLNLPQHPHDIMSRPVQLTPTILRVIPHEGSKCGGAEITVLGRDFVNDGLEVYFGSQKATTTTFWGPASLVCMLPPSPVSGSVPVTIKQSGRRQAVQQSVLFTYKDDDEDQLIRSALGVLASQYGRMVTDPADFARSILYSQTGASGSSGQAHHGNGGNNFTHFSLEHGEAVESGLLRILEMMDLGEKYDSAQLNKASETGQTMLHFACSLGFDRFVAGLLSRGANVHMQDAGGFTPLHLAAINSHAGIIRRLLARGADQNTESRSCLRPINVAKSPLARRALQQVEGHYRSRSTGWRPGRASDLGSISRLGENQPEILASDFDPTLTVDGDDPSDVATTDEDEDWTDMTRNNSLVGLRRRSTAQAHAVDEVDEGPTSPNATMTAIREQIATQLQQFQHSMAMHLQNISQLQMPNIPQMPNLPPMPVLPDYQAYLQSAPVMQRISSLVPNIRTQRQDSTGDHAENPGDNRWGVFPFFGGKDAPPAYDDIFPRGNLDLKQSSAAQAAAEFEADAKCATLFDKASAEGSQTREVPALLQIGRKHLITKEQQETLQRAHAQRLKAGSSDKMLWFVWIPILILVLGAMLWSGAPSFVSGIANIARIFASLAANPRDIGKRIHRMAQELA